MGRKTEVTSVHFQRCLIYPHFAVFYSLTLGKDLNGLPGLEKNLFHILEKCFSPARDLLLLTRRQLYAFKKHISHGTSSIAGLAISGRVAKITGARSSEQRIANRMQKHLFQLTLQQLIDTSTDLLRVQLTH